MLASLGLFAASLVVLMAAARFLTRSAERIGLALGMSPFATGVVIVAIGTSLPELVSGMLAAASGHADVLLGNVLGSSISNLYLVLAGTVLVAGRQVYLGDQYLFIDMHFLVGSTVLLVLTVVDGTFTVFEGGLALTAFGVYYLYLFSEGQTEKPLILHEDTSQQWWAGRFLRRMPWRDVAVVAVSAVGIYYGASYTLQALQDISTGLGVSPAIVSVTLLSLGTTLPETVVSLGAARAGKADIAVGNILGSCIFNALVVPSLGAVVGRIATGQPGLPVAADLLVTVLPFFLVGSLLFYLLALDKRISRYEGLLLLLFYALFIGRVAGAGT